MPKTIDALRSPHQPQMRRFLFRLKWQLLLAIGSCAAEVRETLEFSRLIICARIRALVLRNSDDHVGEKKREFASWKNC